MLDVWVPSVLSVALLSSSSRDLGGLLLVLRGLFGGRPLLLGDRLPGGYLLGGQLAIWRFVLPVQCLGLGFPPSNSAMA